MGKRELLIYIGNGIRLILIHNINILERHFEGEVSKYKPNKYCNILNQTHIVHFRKKEG